MGGRSAKQGRSGPSCLALQGYSALNSGERRLDEREFAPNDRRPGAYSNRGCGCLPAGEPCRFHPLLIPILGQPACSSALPEAIPPTPETRRLLITPSFGFLAASLALEDPLC